MRDSSFDQDQAKLAEEVVSQGGTSVGSGSASFLYNSKTKEIVGRTLGSWLKVILFYLLFCGLLSLLWGLCMGIFFQTLDFYIPKYQQDQGAIGSNPGLGFRPIGWMPSGKDPEGKELPPHFDPYSSLIWFTHGGAGNWQQIKRDLADFLAEYEPGYFANQGASLTKCDFTTTPKTKDQSCEFNKEWLSDQGSDIKCIAEEHFGYYHGKPCILLKLNRIYGWKPVPYYNITEVMEHPTMPKSLKADIKNIYEDKCEGRDWADNCPYMNMVWLHCDGENDPDRENIGLVTYTPFRGFPGYFFPYRNQRGYLSPVVMVQLKGPAPAILMNIECTVWAKNIRHNRMKRTGLVHFELLMD